ncbi:unnamed protein product [Adineta steineri]|uniref:HAT C-terminal dimerisation domain-containing protein n=1 Tax=Adineta steineri TaxID=433720 RepID=A0A819SWZ1_9BILA|nr:unnamed protein product [Adineta steineri]CAF1233992.1 unnamed protein product [Adineta steineri]CAF4078549.1 unnamed protein product [Adineta steineri]CAF4142594.1 unnamed protein product [Adineta steineri]
MSDEEIITDEDSTTDENKPGVLTNAKSPSSVSVERKKRRLKKGVFNREWLKMSEYQMFLKEYKFDSTQATCAACNQQFSIHYRGKTDIDNHMKTQKHQNNIKSFNINQQLITDTIKPSREKDEICAAEAVLVYHGVKHGHSYVSQQCLTNVCKIIFSSSTIANKLSCGRTKATSIALNVLAPYFTRCLLDDLKKSFYYSLHFDASNKGNTKLYPFCIQYLSSSGVKKGIVDLLDDADESANGIFANARQLIKDNDMDFNGLSALGADNTNVNVGENHSVCSLFQEESPDIIKGNCYSHVLHNSVKHAHPLLPTDIEKMLLSIYAHFSRSAKRISELKLYYEFYEQDFKVILKHIKIRWLSLYLSIERLIEVYAPIKKYFLEQTNCPIEIKNFFEREETPCVLSFVQHILFEIHKKNLELQRSYTTLVDLYRIITSIKNKLQERIDSDFFGAACRYRLDRLPTDIQKTLKASFIEFLHAIISYIDSYFDQNVTLYKTISYFGFQNIDSLTWDQVTQCVDLLKIKNLNEDCLFDEFTNIKSTFKMISQQRISIFDQVQTFINKQGDLAVINECNEETNDDVDDHSDNKIVRSDHFWIYMFSLTQSPNFKKLICFLYSLPCSNAYVESAFSQLKFLCNDKRNCMTTELISAELKIRLNSSFSCIEIFKHVLSNQDLLKAIKSDEKYAFKRK